MFKFKILTCVKGPKSEYLPMLNSDRNLRLKFFIHSDEFLSRVWGGEVLPM